MDWESKSHHNDVEKELERMQSCIGQCKEKVCGLAQEVDRVEHRIKTLKAQTQESRGEMCDSRVFSPLTVVTSQPVSNMTNEPYTGYVYSTTLTHVSTPVACLTSAGLLTSPMDGLDISKTVMDVQATSHPWPPCLCGPTVESMSAQICSLGYTLEPFVLSPITPILQPVSTPFGLGWQVVPHAVISPFSLESPWSLPNNMGMWQLNSSISTNGDLNQSPRESIRDGEISETCPFEHHGVSEGIEGCSAGSEIGQLRRSMSLIDKASAGMRLERKARKRKSF